MTDHRTLAAECRAAGLLSAAAHFEAMAGVRSEVADELDAMASEINAVGPAREWRPRLLRAAAVIRAGEVEIASLRAKLATAREEALREAIQSCEDARRIEPEYSSESHGKLRVWNEAFETAFTGLRALLSAPPPAAAPPPALTAEGRARLETAIADAARAAEHVQEAREKFGLGASLLPPVNEADERIVDAIVSKATAGAKRRRIVDGTPAEGKAEMRVACEYESAGAGVPEFAVHSCPSEVVPREVVEIVDAWVREAHRVASRMGEGATIDPKYRVALEWLRSGGKEPGR